MAKPPMYLQLSWEDGLRFQARVGEARSVVDGHGRTAPSPMSTLLAALSACSASDVVEILRKGRQELRGLVVTAHGERRQDGPPHPFERVRLSFLVRGAVDPAKAERAVKLSVETYCSVLHTLRDDLELEWDVRVEEAA